ncbi:lytic transglycosylase domain-containing protein [Paraburkholderia acidisoli]|uniref:lytic transglycosylase domain-containing protein n=1 Tax=Paraburkholderia acidisoli TaxID=2571748 RepID=UPI001E5DC6AC|nr:lytic transglycosylase domain-containing protein [Paraburkholderia acidisoli]
MRTAEVLQSTGFTQSGFNLNLMKQLGNTPLAELQRAAAQYGSDQGRFNVSDRNTDAWYGFLRQIKDAGNFIETHLTNKLSDLAGPLQHFADAVGKDVTVLIDQIFTPANLNALEDGINGFTKYLGSSQFQQDMKDFAGLVAAVAGAMRKAARFLGIDTSPSSSTNPASIPVNPGLDPDEVQRETRGQVRGYGGVSFADKALGYTRHKLNMPSDPRAVLAEMDAKNGLPAGTLEAMWAKESSEGKNLVGPVLRNGDQAIGDLQFTGAAWKDWGKGGDRWNFMDEAKSGGAYMGFLSKRYQGDIAKALAAYDWGPGNVDKTIAQNGANWQKGLPAESMDYIKIAKILNSQKQNVRVTVQNSTAARVAVQANAAAAQ